MRQTKHRDRKEDYMGYFDSVNPELFTIFSGENRNLYYEAIKTISNLCEDGDRVSKDRAKMRLIRAIEENEEFYIVDGNVLSQEDIQKRAAITISQLISHGWVDETKTQIDELIEISRNGRYLYEAMGKMEQKTENFEFKNEIFNVYTLCKEYLDTGYRKSDYYKVFLENAYKTTINLRKKMIEFRSEFSNMVNDLLEEMTAKELFNYINEIYSGQKMMNYARIAHDEFGYYKYKKLIIRAMNYALDTPEEFNAIVSAYESSVESDQQSDDPESLILRMIHTIINFYNEEYVDLVNKMNDTVTDYLKRVENKLKLVFTDKSGQNPADLFLALAIEDGKQNGKYSDPLVSSLLNIWRGKHISEESLAKNIERTAAVVVAAPDTSKDDEIFAKASEKSSLEALNKKNLHNAENTKKYMRAHYGNKKVIYGSEIEVNTKDDYLRFLDMIRHSTTENFPYSINVTGKVAEKTGNVVHTPFELVKKDEEKR